MKAARWVAFTAPELDLIECRDDFRMDLWSLGVLLYFLLCGVGPFVGTQPAILYQKSVGLFEFKIVEPSLNAQDLVKSLLRVDPSERLTVDKILDHTWMTAPDSVLQDLKLDLTKTLFGDWGRKLR